MKTCAKRQSEMLTRCPYCSMEMPQAAVDGHVATCRAARRAAENRRREASFNGGSGGPPVSYAPGAGGCSTGLGLFPEESRADGRSRCGHCGRFFTNTRVHEHREICGRLRQARPPSLGGLRTQLPSRVYNAAAARTTQVGGFDRQRVRLFIPRAMAENSGVLVRCAGVARKIGSRAAATIRPWTVLGVDRHAKPDAVKAAYRRLAKEWHPDRHPDSSKAEAEARFKAIAEAYAALTRPRRKAKLGGQQLALGNSSWRSQRQDFLAALRGSRGGGDGRRAGEGRPARGDEQRVPCPHCGRRFGQLQAERHIPKCASIVNKPKGPPQVKQLPRSPKSGVADRRDALSTGMEVRIHGLSDAAYLNGATGVLQSFDPEVRRWTLAVFGDENNAKAVRPENLQPLREIHGNGHDSSHNRGSGGGTTSSSAKLSSLTPGAAVQLHGLVGAAGLNGMAGLLRSFDAEVGRWHVELANGETKAVRPENVKAASTAGASPAQPSSPKAQPGAPAVPAGTPAAAARRAAAAREAARQSQQARGAGRGGALSCSGSSSSRLPPVPLSRGATPPEGAAGGGTLGAQATRMRSTSEGFGREAAAAATTAHGAMRRTVAADGFGGAVGRRLVRT